jgi:hypothetical protein
MYPSAALVCLPLLLLISLLPRWVTDTHLMTANNFTLFMHIDISRISRLIYII